MATEDTICAIATPPGRGGVGIVRLSGPASARIGQTIAGRALTPRHAHYGPFLDEDNSVLDQGIALYFPSPHSFTGEDVVELQGHGGPVIIDLLLRRAMALGARLARPGEFSERAFLNDKLDLAQAEAIADLIAAASEQAARSAVRSLQGEFSQSIADLVAQCIELRIYVEAAIDFPEEEIDFLSDGHVAASLQALKAQLQTVLASARRGTLLQEGMTVVIAGRPNAGKSSLLNALAGQDSAIVTDIAGTTRDTLRESIQIDGLPLHIIDTAGLRDSEDTVEKLGIERAWVQIRQADLVLWIVDSVQTPCLDTSQAEDPLWSQLPPELPVVQVRNKVDLSGESPGLTQTEPPLLRLSAATGEGLADLRNYLKQTMGYDGSTEGGFIARRRHLQALEQAAGFLDSAEDQLHGAAAGELVAEDLRQVQQALNEITGEFTSDDLLGRIFSSFCIGK
ncbi:MAG: tRNA uridine-5-carboxymethylaminomethyl(34) synthesis GTPase MnmE [Natronospirillum sp.]|uniref:tRNA uridine-5-carboxymethylaminomethyl(34) synthesis GTPase MnmE n=1 Tax=Natronospirillum sp. TaxID=2812955 RepID=UPI0025CEA8BB|nr:tRNA uridine-5-carboxymethylaminomethyl(34) synthesis GTPase MnmE [Natronospirillum sp.]MCH8551739.1 tRNA uridine-5-carboxymethylaminomethyl(34) synthesis GTPase MnmE [Natronospirillum sp.]